MPIATIKQDVKPPETRVATSEYGLLYSALYDAKVNTWLKITIRHKLETRIMEIARVRRAVQRWFAQADNKKYRMISRVENIDEHSSDMYIYKEAR